ncbi:MAG: ABC-2 family transporter protein [Microlunatus sp.]
MRGAPVPTNRIGRISRRSRFRASVAIAVLAGRSLWVYRSGLVISAVVLLVQILALRMVWTWVYAGDTAVPGSGGAGEISLPVQLAYVTLSTVQFWVLNHWGVYSLQERVREGRIGTDLARPLDLLWQVTMGRIGTIAGCVPFAMAALVIAMVFGGVAAPASVAALLGYLVALALATVISVQLVLLLDMTSFWSLEVTGIYLSFTLVSRFLSGSLVPLWFMPDWLRILAGLLPFQATTFSPVAIYVGVLQGPAMWQALGVAAGWVVILGVALRLTWGRVLNRVVVQGG